MDKNKKKVQFNFREAYERIDAINARIEEMATALENDKERESLTEAEKKERVQLEREKDILEMKIKSNTQIIELNAKSNLAEAERQMRECVLAGKRFEVKISRDFGGNTSGYADYTKSENPFPLTLEEIVEPLWGKLILSAIGSPLLTGLKGNHQWPVIETFAATINDEAVELGDTKIPVGKLTAKPERIGIAVPITREALTETDNLLQLVATQYIPTAAAALMNQIMFSTTKVAGATNLVGPFVEMKDGHTVTAAGDTPTLKELVNLKGIVLNENIVADQLCYVMSETMKAELEATPKWDGANDAIIDDNGNIKGVPVFTTSYCEAGKVYFGAFKYAPQGIFGDMSFIVDPYTLARKNAVDFVLNLDYAITTLREEAFAILETGSNTGDTGGGEVSPTSTLSAGTKKSK